ncbi:MAG: sensor histidine kinase, partial [Bdellovibrionales bacterium]
SGNILAQNLTGREMPLKFNPDERFQTYSINGRHVRILNIRSRSLVIQVGTVMGPRLISTLSILNMRFAGVLLVICSILVAAAMVSSRLLFAPLHRLTLELASMSSQLDQKLGRPLTSFIIGPEMSRLGKSSDQKRDEFELLCAEIANFLEKLESHTRTFHAQVAILTHELKTPLAVIQTRMDEIARTNDLSAALELAKQATNDVRTLARTIDQYLQWSVLASAPEKPSEIHAIKFASFCRNFLTQLPPEMQRRLDTEIHGEFTVFALPEHLQQLVANLVTNAIKYSPVESRIKLRVLEQRLEVLDSGPGLPTTVLENLGTPFNRGPKVAERGTGLGLAWVMALTDTYGWKLKIDSTSQGTQILVTFG